MKTIPPVPRHGYRPRHRLHAPACGGIADTPRATCPHCGSRQVSALTDPRRNPLTELPPHLAPPRLKSLLPGLVRCAMLAGILLLLAGSIAGNLWVLPAGALLLFVAQWQIRQLHAEYRRRKDYPRRIGTWLRLYRCHDCNRSYRPGTGSTPPPSRNRYATTANPASQQRERHVGRSAR